MVYMVSVQYEMKVDVDGPADALPEALRRIEAGEVPFEYSNVWPQKLHEKESE
jgi:hypothetical protein